MDQRNLTLPTPAATTIMSSSSAVAAAAAAAMAGFGSASGSVSGAPTTSAMSAATTLALATTTTAPTTPATFFTYSIPGMDIAPGPFIFTYVSEFLSLITPEELPLVVPDQMTDEQKLSTFMKRHGVREEVARQYLSSNNWSLEVASGIYESDTAAKEEPDPKTEKSSTESPATENDSQRDLHSLISQHSRRRENDQDGYQAENSGSSTSGQEKRVGIGNSTPALTTIDSDRSLRVWGHGVPLGSAHPIHPPPVRPPGEDSDNEPTDDEHTIVVLHLWSEGFSLDDGSLRLYALPENERFLRAVLRGDYPAEMLDNRPRVQLSVQDHTNESFRLLSRKQFMGPGRPLNGPTPKLGVAGPSQLELPAVQLNEGAAITTVQLRLADGSRVAVRFNLTHNIGDLYRYARLASPQFSARNFVLMTAFPRQELLETDTRTLIQANLCNVVVIQHLNEEQAAQLSSDNSEHILQ